MNSTYEFNRRELAQDPEKLHTITLLVTDIRDFSVVAKQTEGATTGDFINEFVKMTLRAVGDRYDPVKQDIDLVDFLGDGWLMFFKDPVKAVDLALNMRAQFRLLKRNYHFDTLGLKTAINTDSIMLKYFGSPPHDYFRGVGTGVILTFRLAAKAQRDEILITHRVKPEVEKHVISTEMDEIGYMKGVSEPLFPILVFRKKREKETLCCKSCRRYECCFAARQTARDERVVNSRTQKRFTREKMLCSLINEDHLICTIGQSCKYVKNCLENELRKDRGEPDRPCCDSCQFYNTCIFNWHRGKNGEDMVCCEECGYFYAGPCPQQIRNVFP